MTIPITTENQLLLNLAIKTITEIKKILMIVLLLDQKSNSFFD